MKSPLSIIFFLLSAGNIIAQPQLDNAGFEVWEGSGTSAEPAEWSSIKTSTGGVAFALPQVCFQTTDAHTGSSAVRIRTGILPAQTVTGIITSGRVHASQTEGAYVYTDVNNAQWNNPMLDRPDSLVVWYKATPQAMDFAEIQATVHFSEGRIPEGGTLGNWIGQTSWTGAPGVVVAEWTRISIPFNYIPDGAPEFILLAMTSSQVGNSLANSEVLFDDVTLIYNITPVLSDDVATVTALDGFPMQVAFSTQGTPISTTTFSAEMSDSNGDFASPITIGSITTALSFGIIDAVIPANTVSGNGYRIRVSNPDPNYAPISAPIAVIQTSIVGISNYRLPEISVAFQNERLLVSISKNVLKAPMLELIASTGQTVFAISLPTQAQHSIDVGALRGFYLLRISDNEHAVVKRVVLF